jgi:hypothetical protein
MKRLRSAEESGGWDLDSNVMPRHVAKRRRLYLLPGSETIYQSESDDGSVRLFLSISQIPLSHVLFSEAEFLRFPATLISIT